MQTYDCHVRLANSMTSEVPKFGVTAPEIMVLRLLHGDDAVVRINPRIMDKRTHASERERLQRIYGDGNPKINPVERLFGLGHIPLPITLDPANETAVAEAVAKAEAEAAEKTAAEKALFDEAVKREAARLEGVRLAKEAHDRNNDDTPAKSGTLHLKK